MTGFRVAYGGAQTLYDVAPDLTCLGKVVGGGMPAAAFGGSANIMDCLAPDGAVYQAGTLSGNPLAMAAGVATLNVLKSENPYPLLESRSKALADGFGQAAQDAGIATTLNRVGSMMTCFFQASETVTDYASAKRSDTKLFGRYFAAMRERGIFLAPSQFEALFVSTAHTDADIEKTLTCAAESLKAIAD